MRTVCACKACDERAPRGARRACQPPMPICTRFSGRTFGIAVAWKYGVVCIRSSRSVSWMSACRSKWMIPAAGGARGVRAVGAVGGPRRPRRVPSHTDALRRHRRQPAHRREADRVVAAEDDGEGARRRDVRHRVRDLVERLLDVRRDREDVARVAPVRSRQVWVRGVGELRRIAPGIAPRIAPRERTASSARGGRRRARSCTASTAPRSGGSPAARSACRCGTSCRRRTARPSPPRRSCRRGARPRGTAPS